MLNLKSIYKLQTDYSVSNDGSYRENETSFTEYVAGCRMYFHKNLPKEYATEWTNNQKEKHATNLIHEFVSKRPVRVEGYVMEEGTLDTRRLSEDLIAFIMGYGILTQGYEDPEVDEFQINDIKTIYVSKNGILSYYVDEKGRPYQFISDEEMRTTLNRIIDDGTGNIPQFTDGNPILNAKAAKKDYRINAVHNSVITRGFEPYDFASSAIVIRKFKEVKLTLEDLVKYDALTSDMSRFLQIASRAGVKMFCVGPTGSGKTTLLQGILQSVPTHKRIILAQNPTEITFFDRDQYGRALRNVLHMTMTEFATLSNLVENKMRQSPEVGVIGELREGEEFFQARRFMLTGHQTFGSFHAENGVDAVERYSAELSSTGAIDDKEARKSVSRILDLVITQLRFDDGKRRVIEIAEILDSDSEGKVNVNILFKFEPTGEVVITKDGLRDTKGVFKQVGYLSASLRDKFFLHGVSKEELADFLEPVEEGVSA